MEIFNTLILILINALIKLAPLWVPVVLVVIAFSVWVKYIRKNFINSIKWTLLEIRIPKEIQYFDKLRNLDLKNNKIKRIPKEIQYLNQLIEVLRLP